MLDLETVPVIREIRIYVGKNGTIRIPLEYRGDVSYGPNIRSIAVDLYSEGGMSNDRICRFLNTISGNVLELSEGSVYGFCKSFSQKCIPHIAQIEEELLNAKTVRR